MFSISCIVFLIVFSLLQILPANLAQIDGDDPPLSKSLGFSVRGKLGRTLEDARLNQEYMGLYRDMLRASQERFHDMEEQRLEDVLGKERLQVMKRGVLERRRKASGIHSAIGRRRARSQASRREKLNNQSLRSHQEHIRQSGQEYHLDS